MFLVTATLPTGPVPGEEALDQLVRRLAVPEDLLEHVHVAPLPGGGSRLTLFLGHAQSAGAEESAVRLVARALPPAVGAAATWTPATGLRAALEQLGLRSPDKELPSQEADTQ
ncbi:hypothetical protein ACQYWQ_09635 [Streptomyces sp. P6-2-1]|uniref:hypothetical protein n=1 Tax=Streptomyces sp. P6-2-1 TaxID=3422591 RepID=UPI003D368699